MRLSATVGIFVLCAKLVAQVPPTPTGQLETPPPSERFPAEWYSPQAQDPYHPLPEVEATSSIGSMIGVPFSGTTVMSTRISLPGQAPQFSVLREVTMRDSAGRTRIEQVFDVDRMPAAIASQMKRQISVNDVVAHCSFDWVEPATKEADKTATVQCFPRPMIRRLDGTECKQPDRVENKQPDGMESKMTRQVGETTHPFPWQTLQIEPLGQKNIAGLNAFGIRQTLIDTNMNAGQPQVTEIWWSPEIKEMLKATPVGDSGGRPTIEMIDIKRNEPDPAEFYPPAGYKIVTGPLPF
jgi:hypothetical protein